MESCLDNDSASPDDRGAGETLGGSLVQRENAGIPDEAMSGQGKANGWLEVRFDYVGRASDVSAHAEKLLRTLYPLFSICSCLVQHLFAIFLNVWVRHGDN